jgi:hypothetical protein
LVELPKTFVYLNLPLTKQINLIEQELGIELFDKTKRLLHKSRINRSWTFSPKDASRFTEQFDRMLENTKKLGSKANKLILDFIDFYPNHKLLSLPKKYKNGIQIHR